MSTPEQRADAIRDPLIGSVLAGRYEVLKRVGRGGMANVYQGRDRRLGRIVAIKVLFDHLRDDPSYVRTFDREAMAVSKLDDLDPHIVSLFDRGEDQGRLYIIMEYVEGYTLRELLAREKRLSPKQALIIMESVAAALAAAHNAGIMHRDIKPGNVLISTKGQIKVTDFGLAKPLDAATSALTQDQIFGTVAYVAPERALKQIADTRADVYSAGVLLFEMLTGQKPYQGANHFEIAKKHTTEDIPAPSTVLGPNSVPSWLDELVIAMTRRDPNLRPQDGTELLHRVRIARQALAANIWDDESVSDAVNPMRALTTGRVPTGSAEADLAAQQPVSAQQYDESDTQYTDQSDYEYAEPDADSEQQSYPGMDDTPGMASGDLAEPDEAPKPRVRISHDRKFRRRRAIIVTLVIALLAAAIGYGSWWFTAGRYTVMPTITGITQLQAQERIDAADLRVKFQEAYDDNVEKGNVIRANHDPDSKILRNTEVEAFVSLGPELVPMVAVEGTQIEDAKTAITNGRLVVGEITEVYDDSAAAGVVLQSQYPVGEQLKVGTRVDLTVSKGKQPIDMQDFTGKAYADAEAWLQEQGLVASRSDDQFSDSVAAGSIISQNPASGQVYKGDTVTFVVSKGPEMATVPTGIVFNSVTNATKLLKDAGFDVKVVYEGIVQLGLVMSSDPDEGAVVRKGSTVTLHCR